MDLDLYQSYQMHQSSDGRLEDFAVLQQNFAFAQSVCRPGRVYLAELSQEGLQKIDAREHGRLVAVNYHETTPSGGNYAYNLEL